MTSSLLAKKVKICKMVIPIIILMVVYGIVNIFVFSVIWFEQVPLRERGGICETILEHIEGKMLL